MVGWSYGHINRWSVSLMVATNQQTNQPLFVGHNRPYDQQRELPGLRGFSAQNIRNMRQFAEFWQPFLIHSPMRAKWNLKICRIKSSATCSH